MKDIRHGESFTLITGVDIAFEDLEGEWPEGFEAGPTEVDIRVVEQK